jgi:hypothetical protein
MQHTTTGASEAAAGRRRYAPGMLASRVRATGELVPARWLDAALVAGLLVAVAADAVGGPPAPDPPVAALLLAVAQVVPLWWRRSHPLPVVAVQLAAYLVATVVLEAGGAAYLALLPGIYTVASLRGARLGLLAAGAELAVKGLAVRSPALAPARCPTTSPWTRWRWSAGSTCGPGAPTPPPCASGRHAPRSTRSGAASPASCTTWSPTTCR